MTGSDKDMTNQIATFRGKQIRKTIHNNEWWFVVEDVVLALIDSSDPKQYIQRMKQRDLELDKGWVQFVHTLEISTEGGKQKMNCANTEGIFRIIQSIPSPKAEPFKRWLAKVGYEPAIVIASDRRERGNLWLNNLYDRKQKLFCLYQYQ
ncbi:MAG: Bro-N domain-containing protein [bacterium]|nr:Bro-N domain-containing protein [bacterium]